MGSFVEAYCSGLDPFGDNLIRNNRSIYAEAKQKQFKSMNIMEQLKVNWYWDMKQGFIPKCFYQTLESGKAKFCGVIATHRRISKKSLSISFWGWRCILRYIVLSKRV